MDVAELALRVDSKDVLTADKRMTGLNKTAGKSPKIIGALAGALATVGFVALAKDALSTYSAFETMNASLKTVTGSYENASVAMALVEKFASTTPFSLEQATQGFIKLKSLGLDPSATAMNSYGNTAAAMGKDLNQMIEAVADATTGEFERLKEFGIRSKTVGDNVQFTFQGVTTSVGKNATEIEKYLRSIGDVNFAGAMTDQMDTIKGATSNLSDNFAKLQRDFIEVTGLGEAYKETLFGISDAIAGVDFEVMSAELSTWSAFGDDISSAYDELSNFIGKYIDLGDTSSTVGQAMKDYFLDYPAIVKGSYNQIMAYAEYSLDYILIKYKQLDLQLGNIWTHIGGSSKVMFAQMQVYSSQATAWIAQKFAELLTSIGHGLAKLPNGEKWANEVFGAASRIMVTSLSSVQLAQDNLTKATTGYNSQLEVNKTAISAYDQALIAIGKHKDNQVKTAIKSVKLAKEERQQQVLMTKEMNEAIKQFAELDTLEKKNVETVKKSVKATKTKTKALTDEQKTAKKLKETMFDVGGAVKKSGLEFNQGAEFLAGLTEEEKTAIKAIEDHQKAREDFFKTEALLNKERELGYKLIEHLTQAESQAYAVRQKNRELDDKYKDTLKDINDRLEYQIILNTKGADAARLHTLEQELGSKTRAEIILQKEKLLEISQDETLAYGKLEDALGSYIKTGLEGFVDLGDQVDSFTKSIFDLAKGQGGIANIGAEFSKMISPFKDGGIAGSIGNAFNASSLVGALGGSQTSQYVSGVASLLSGGNPIVTAVAAIASEIFNFGPKLRIKLDQSITDIENGFTDYDGALESQRGRDSILGNFGVNHRSTQVASAGEEWNEALQSTLDSMLAVDDLFLTFANAAQQATATSNISNIEIQGGDLSSFAKARVEAIVDSLSQGLQDYVGAGTFEEQAANINKISEAYAISDQLMSDLDITIKDTNITLAKLPDIFGGDLKISLNDAKEKAVLTTLSLVDMAGGMDALLSANANFMDKIYTDEQKLDYVVKQHQQTLSEFYAETGAKSVQSASDLYEFVENLKASGAIATEEGQKQLLSAYAAADAFAYFRDQIEETSATVVESVVDISSAVSVFNTQVLSETQQTELAAKNATRMIDGYNNSLTDNSLAIDGTRNQFINLVRSVEANQSASSDAYQNLIRMSSSIDIVADIADDAISSFDAIGVEITDLVYQINAIDISIANVGVVPSTLTSQAQAAIDTQNALISSLQSQDSAISSTASTASSAATSAYNEAINYWNAQQSSALNGREYLESLKLDTNLTNLLPAEQLAEAQRQFNEAIIKKDVDAAQSSMDAVLSLSRSAYASSDAYDSILNETTGQFSVLLSSVESMVKPVEPLESIGNQQISIGNSQLTAAQAQLSVLQEQLAHAKNADATAVLEADRADLADKLKTRIGDLDLALNETMRLDLPVGIQTQLAGNLESIRSATDNEALQVAMDATKLTIDNLPVGIQSQLDPNLSKLIGIESTARTEAETAFWSFENLRHIKELLRTQNQNWGGQEPIEWQYSQNPVFPSYDVGSKRLTKDQFMLGHKDERILTAGINDDITSFLADYNSGELFKPVVVNGNNNSEVVAELRKTNQKLDEHKKIIEQQSKEIAELRKERSLDENEARSQRDKQVVTLKAGNDIADKASKFNNNQRLAS